jgi:hypothetical protein
MRQIIGTTHTDREQHYIGARNRDGGQGRGGGRFGRFNNRGGQSYHRNQDNRSYSERGRGQGNRSQGYGRGRGG